MVTELSLQIEDVSVTRSRKTILGPISLNLPGHGLTMVVGPNGAGKTTFLKVMHGVERISSGRITWLNDEKFAQKSQAYVFQTPVMLRRSVAQNLSYPLQLQKRDKKTTQELVGIWAERIGLTHVLDQPAQRLSGGEKQKLALGRALIREPKVLFLDEPCANLDESSTKDIEALVLAAYDKGTRIIMTTHNLGQCRRLARDVIFMWKGQIHEHAPTDTFFETPTTPQAQAFVRGDIVE